MNISARVENRLGQHRAEVTTNDISQTVAIPPRDTGTGSSVNGGELLFLALATCYCNDIYREAAKRGIQVESVQVEVHGEFGAAGEPARNLTYSARVEADATDADIRDLIMHTDSVAEIHNTLRAGSTVTLDSFEAISKT